MYTTLPYVLALANFAFASPTLRGRTVTSLDGPATAEAQQRDDTATRAFSGTQIKTSDGKCLFVDKLSGDFRENLTPIQVGACGNSDGWDIITAGKHINAANSMLVVSTTTQACLNFDDRRKAGNQVLLFSCGGRADGGGAQTNSQAFGFIDGSGQIKPSNANGQCIVVNGNVLDIGACGGANSQFTFGGAGAAGSNGAAASSSVASTSAVTTSAAATKATSEVSQATSSAETDISNDATAQCGNTVTVTVTADASQDTKAADAGTAGNAAVITTAATTASETSSSATTTSQATAASSSAGTVAAGNEGGKAIPNPSTPVPVSRAGGVLVPTAVAESQERDDTATRAFTSVSIKAPNGQCLFIDPTAGDFRENLIPVSLVTCGGTPNEKFDVITKGKHNDGTNPAALIVSSLMNGCISFDGRRAVGDTVTMFSCGGRADGVSGTNLGQLMPFAGQESFAFAPVSDKNATCILPGDAGRLVSGACPANGASLFSVVP